MAVRLCEPLVALVVSHETEYGAAVTSAPRFVPSSWNCTPTTPTLSDSVADTVSVPETIAEATGAVMLMVGGILSIFATGLKAAIWARYLCAAVKVHVAAIA